MSDSKEIKSFEELKKQSKIRHDLKLDIYTQHLTLILKKISEVSTMLDQDHLIYQVPEVVMGHPFYDIDDCCNWLREKILKKGAKKVTLFGKGVMLIEWDH